LSIVVILLLLVLFIVPMFEESDTWLSKYHLIILIAAIYVIINVLNHLKSHHFISYSDQGEMIIFRYYPLNLFNSKKHSIEIPKGQFIKYELKPFYFGRHQKIILYQNFRNRSASYPPISLSALDKEDQERILASLNKYVKG